MTASSTRGTLHVVAVPLGNPEDLSPRAARTLREADVVVAEDTRSAARLLADLGTTKRLLSCYDANEAERAHEVARLLTQGQQVALISEAGTPLVSDPGFRVVAAAIEAGARVVAVPGPSAVLAALVGSGLPTHGFVFLGFPPRKSGARRRLFDTLRDLPVSIVAYESPLRTAATLQDLAAVLGRERRACVARELTKTHEEYVRGSLGELAARYQDGRPLGEITIVVEGRAGGLPCETEDELEERARALLSQGLSARDAARELAEETGRPRREVYAVVTALVGRDEAD